MKTKSFAYSLRVTLMLYSILLLACSCPFATAVPYRNISVETTTLEGSHPSLDQVDISKRGELEEQDKGTEAITECKSYYRCQSKYDKHLHVDTINDLPDVPEWAYPPVTHVDPVNPPGNLQCKLPPAGHYRHAHKKRVKAATMEFCNDYCLPEFITPDILPIKKMFSVKKYYYKLAVDDWSVTYLRHKKINKRDDVFDLRVDMVRGCTPQGGVINLRTPLNDTNTCKDILYSAWHNCDNKGRGGSQDAGCVRYTIATRF